MTRHRNFRVTPEAEAQAERLGIPAGAVRLMARQAAPFTHKDFPVATHQFEGVLFGILEGVVETVQRRDTKRRARATDIPMGEILTAAADVIRDLLEDDTDPAIKENAAWVLDQIDRS